MRRHLGHGLLLLLVFWPAAALADHYVVVAGGDSGVVFKSRAPLEKFEGKTNQVAGWLEVDLAALDSLVTLEVQVDLASFDTGMGKRNKHMRENHFETDKYPLATFRGGRINSPAPGSLAVGENGELQLTGTLDLHGVTREMTCFVILFRPTTDTLAVEARFEVLLPDHRIKRPKFLVMKLAEDQEVVVHLLLKKES